MSQRPTDRARIDLGEFIIGRIEKEGRTFEMLLAPDKAWEAKKIIRDEINKRLVEGKDKSRITVEELLKNPKISIELIFESFIVFEDLRRGKKLLTVIWKLFLILAREELLRVIFYWMEIFNGLELKEMKRKIKN